MNLSAINQSTLEEIRGYCRQEFNKEACGVVAEGKVIHSKNLAGDPTKYFVMSPAIWSNLSEVDFTWHSHCSNQEFSFADIAMCRQLKLPMYLFKLPIGKDDFYDPNTIEPLIGREFTYWIRDCWALVKDWYKLHQNVDLPDPPRELKDENGVFHWNQPHWDMYRQMLPEKFHQVEFNSGLQRGDLILSTIRFQSPPTAPNSPNHIAVVEDPTKNLLLDHFYGSISSQKVYGQERRKQTDSIWRLKKEQNPHV
jgi:proteasome lid subunit RPN8/RPN11